MQRRTRRNLEPLLTAPAMLLILAVLVAPVFYALYLSLHRADYMNVTAFRGLGNFIKLLGDARVMRSIGTTMTISFASLAISMGLGVMLALWVDKRGGRFAYLIQIVGLIPWVTSMVVGGLLWKWIFDPDRGILNYLIRLAGLGPINIYQTASSAVWAVIVVMAWRTIGYAMVMVLAGLKGIPGELLEAGSVDGASRFQVFARIKLPLIRTPMLISSIVLFMSNFNNVTIPMVLTGGGPGSATSVTSLELYRTAFNYYKFGEASALSLIVFLLNTVLTIVYIKAVKYDG